MTHRVSHISFYCPEFVIDLLQWLSVLAAQLSCPPSLPDKILQLQQRLHQHRLQTLRLKQHQQRLLVFGRRPQRLCKILSPMIRLNIQRILPLRLLKARWATRTTNGHFRQL